MTDEQRSTLEKRVLELIFIKTGSLSEVEARPNSTLMSQLVKYFSYIDVQTNKCLEELNAE